MIGNYSTITMSGLAVDVDMFVGRVAGGESYMYVSILLIWNVHVCVHTYNLYNAVPFMCRLAPVIIQ